MDQEVLHSLADDEIVIRIRAGQKELFAELVRRYRTPLLRLSLSRLQRVDWAEDAVQEALLGAFKSLHTFDSRYSFRTWLWTIQLNQCRRQLKHREKWMRVAFDKDCRMEQRRQRILEGSQEDDPARTSILDERLRQIEAALSSMPPKMADAVRLRFFGELRFQEIADALGCSLSSAKNWVRDGLVQLEALLRPLDHSAEEVESSSNVPLLASTEEVKTGVLPQRSSPTPQQRVAGSNDE